MGNAQFDRHIPGCNQLNTYYLFCRIRLCILRSAGQLETRTLHSQDYFPNQRIDRQSWGTLYSHLDSWQSKGKHPGMTEVIGHTQTDNLFRRNG